MLEVELDDVTVVSVDEVVVGSVVLVELEVVVASVVVVVGAVVVVPVLHKQANDIKACVQQQRCGNRRVDAAGQPNDDPFSRLGIAAGNGSGGRRRLGG